MATSSKSFIAGRWRIVSMSAWDQEFIGEEEEGYFEFDQKNNGQLHFGYVHGQMDFRSTQNHLNKRSIFYELENQIVRGPND